MVRLAIYPFAKGIVPKIPLNNRKDSTIRNTLSPKVCLW